MVRRLFCAEHVSSYVDCLMGAYAGRCARNHDVWWVVHWWRFLRFCGVIVMTILHLLGWGNMLIVLSMTCAVSLYGLLLCGHHDAFVGFICLWAHSPFEDYCSCFFVFLCAYFPLFEGCSSVVWIIFWELCLVRKSLFGLVHIVRLSKAYGRNILA